MTFFVKRYLFTTNEDHHALYEYELLRFQTACSQDNLPLTFTEYFSMPIFMREIMLENQKTISQNRSTSIDSIIKSK
jgi:hypothetical protein